MNKGVLWSGKNFITPQAASVIDSSALTPVTLGGANNLAILGNMIGLIPSGAITCVSDPSLAQSLLNPLSDDAIQGVKLAFAPSPGANGAAQIFLIPVNAATQASVTIGSVLTFLSFMFGIPANQIKLKVETGTLIGKKITVSFQGNTETFDNLAKSSFSVQYIGAGSACAMTILPTLAGHSLATICAGATADNLSLDMTSFTTIQALCDAISSAGPYTVTVLAQQANTDLSMNLDAVITQDIKTAPYTAASNMQACLDGINGKSNYITVSSVVDAGAAPANVDWTFLTGAVNGTTTTTDWQNALNLLKTVQMDIIVPLSSDPAIHSMVDAHCVYMSGFSGKSERRSFVGGVLQSYVGEVARAAAIAALVTAASNLNSDRTVHCGLGSVTIDQNGNSTLYPGYQTACMYAGIAAGNSPVFPLTNKFLNCSALEVDLRPDEIDTLLDAGIAPPIPDTVNGGYIVSRQLTTWNQSDDLYRTEYSVGRGADYIAAQVRARHKTLVGQPGLLGQGTTIVNLTNAVLQAALTDGYITSFDPKQTTLRVVGTVWYVDYSAVPVLPINFVFSTYHLLPTNFTIGL